MSTVIIPAAGLATRLRPISNFTSKSMVPINGKPAISYIIDQIKDWATDIRIVYGKSDDIVEYCSRAYSDLPIRFFKQEEALGPLHAIYCALTEQDQITKHDQDVTVWLGDTIVLDFKHRYFNGAKVVYGKVPDWDRWCLIDEDGKLHDKPEQNPGTDRALVGIYQFSRFSTLVNHLCNIMESNITVKGEYQISQLIEKYRHITQIETTQWYDCGDFPSLYESRARLLNRLSRDDNQLSVDTITGTITKSGSRCLSEIEWYRSLPQYVKPFVPTIYSIDDNTSYTMEYCPGTSLQDILVYENLKEDTLNYTLDKVLQVYDICFVNRARPRTNKSSIYMWIEKNLDRFNKYHQYEFIKELDLRLMKSVVESNLFYNIIKQNNFVNVIHGDLHFGNILFDYNTGKSKFIDPRGNWNNVITNNGDLEYDIAKMYQSAYCEYMWIINNVKTDTNVRDQIVNKLDEKFSKDYNVSALKMMSAIMMASCLPFHNDDPKRQQNIWEVSIKKLKESHEEYRLCEDREVDQV